MKGLPVYVVLFPLSITLRPRLYCHTYPNASRKSVQMVVEKSLSGMRSRKFISLIYGFKLQIMVPFTDHSLGRIHFEFRNWSNNRSRHDRSVDSIRIDWFYHRHHTRTYIFILINCLFNCSNERKEEPLDELNRASQRGGWWDSRHGPTPLGEARERCLYHIYAPKYSCITGYKKYK